MDRFFTLFGKITLVLVILGGISYAAYTLGKSSLPNSQFGAVSTTAMPQPTTEIASETTPSGSITPQAKQTKVVKAGLDASSGLSFTKYQLMAPEDWTVSHTTTNEGTWVDTLTLTKGTSQLKLFQAATGGAMCLYPLDADFEGPSSRYDTYVDITTQDNIILRRGTTNANSGTTKGYTMCQKGTENFGQPTVFGHMSLTTALNPDNMVLSEVDAMLASLKKQ